MRQTPARQDPSVLTGLLDQLACPVCLGSFRVSADRLTCSACGRNYPVVDGIPILIPTGESPNPVASPSASLPLADEIG